MFNIIFQRFLLLCALLQACAPAALAWDNPHRSAAAFGDVPAAKISRLQLENRRVQTIQNDSFTYNTGRKVITVQCDSFACRRFIRDVRAGRKAARTNVTLTPRRISPFNAEYKAR